MARPRMPLRLPVRGKRQVNVVQGDCLDVLPTLPADSIDACVTDPPYGLGFMGKAWDDGIAFQSNTWIEVLRVMKPGAHLVAFGGTRTYHRLVCAIEDAGFEIRDAIMWHYASGFPKSRNVSVAIDKAAGAEREVVGPSLRHGGGREFAAGASGFNTEVGNLTAPATDAARQWAGWGTALKPATEIICLARKPLSEPTVAANVLRWGTGAINVNGCRVGAEGGTRKHDAPKHASGGIYGNGLNGGGGKGREIDAGRWPANVVHDGSPEVMQAFAAFGTDNKPNGRPNCAGKLYRPDGRQIYGKADQAPYDGGYGDTGTAARFFKSAGYSPDELRFMYAAKADAADRCGSKHPTVKPIALMRWLCRMITPVGGIVLDPFAGSGTTLQAALAAGFPAVGIERDVQNVIDIRYRIDVRCGMYATVL